MRSVLARPVVGNAILALVVGVVSFVVLFFWHPGWVLGMTFAACLGSVAGVTFGLWRVREDERRRDLERLEQFDASCRALGFEPPGQTIYLGDIAPGESRTIVVRKADRR
jgi:hypothetical protein